MTEEEFEAIGRRLVRDARSIRSSGALSAVHLSAAGRAARRTAAHGFKTFIVSGGGIDLIRAFAEEAYRNPARAGVSVRA
jgi:phosphoserine phosphatase